LPIERILFSRLLDCLRIFLKKRISKTTVCTYLTKETFEKGHSSSTYKTRNTRALHLTVANCENSGVVNETPFPNIAIGDVRGPKIFT